MISQKGMLMSSTFTYRSATIETPTIWKSSGKR